MKNTTPNTTTERKNSAAFAAVVLEVRTETTETGWFSFTLKTVQALIDTQNGVATVAT